jgi:hypothetical protein
LTFPLPIVAAAGFIQPAGDTPTSLREELRTLTPNAPRRINRLSELGLIGAHRCVAGRDLADDTAVVVATTTGCLNDSVQLLRAVGDRRPPMPMDFINVSSNMTGFHLAAGLRLHSSNLVVASADFAWEAAIEVAMLGSRRFLAGAIEECAWPLAQQRERLGLATDVQMLESSQWLWVDRDAASPIARINRIHRLQDDAELAAYKASADWPRDCEISVHGDGAASPYSGIAAAAACIDAVTRRAKSFVYLNRGRTGQWCVTEISAP